MKQIFRYISVVMMLFVSMTASAQSTVKVMTITNGTVSVDKTSASKNEQVTVTVTPSDGYYFQKENLEVVKTVNPSLTRTRGDIPVAGEISISGSDPVDLSVSRTYTFTVPDDGYELQVSATFTARTSITDDMVTLSATDFTYTGSDQKPTVSVNGLTEGTDYTVTFAETSWVNAGTYSVSVSGISMYKGTITKTFTISAPEKPSIVDDENPVDVDGQTLYEPTKEVDEAIKETIEADIALTAEAESRVQVTEDGGLRFSKGEDMLIGLLGLKLNDIVTFVFTGRLYGDNSKLRKRNASSSRGTRTAGDLEIISGVEYEVIEAGDQTITVALEEVETIVETITVTEETEPDQPVIVSEGITISKAKQVPYYSEYNLDFTDKPGLKAYVATGYDKAKGTIWLTRVKQVPAQTGFLLMGEPGDYEIPVSESASNIYYKNMFKGTLEGITIQTTEGKYTNYYLSNGKSGVGFYKVTNADGQKIGANRCYLPILTDILDEGSEGDAEVIKVSAAKQVPYYTSKNIDFTSLDAQGVKAYTATGYNYETGIIWLTRVKKVPAQTGILVMADKEGEYSVPTTSVQSVYENMFTGSETAQTIYTTETVGDIEYINYYLSNGTSGVGFYKVTNENGVKMSANRSYLQIPKREKASGARGMDGHASFSKMVISDDDDDVIAIPVFGGDATGISDVHQRVEEQEVYYNFIRNGKKVVIK